MKENGSTVIRVRGVWKSLLCVNLTIKQKIWTLVYLTLDKWFYNNFLTNFLLFHGHSKNEEDKIYPAMNSPAHGELDSTNFILVVDCIHKLFKLIHIFIVQINYAVALCRAVILKVVSF